jgi:hypothetical protein
MAKEKRNKALDFAASLTYAFLIIVSTKEYIVSSLKGNRFDASIYLAFAVLLFGIFIYFEVYERLK